MLNLLAVLDLADEDLGGLETWNIMLIYHNSRISGNVPGYFLFAFLIDETAKTTHVNIMSAGHGVLNNGEEGLYGSSYIGFVDACLICDLIDYVCFGHVSGCL